jgi:hypothetical protein
MDKRPPHFRTDFSAGECGSSAEISSIRTDQKCIHFEEKVSVECGSADTFCMDEFHPQRVQTEYGKGKRRLWASEYEIPALPHSGDDRYSAV